ISENQRSYVFVAQLVGTPQANAALVALPRPNRSADRGANKVVLRITTILVQNDPMLDFSVSPPGELLVLEPGRVVVYRRQGNGWERQQELPIAHQHPFPRDLRGRLQITAERGVNVFLPGTQCSSSAPSMTLPMTMSCRDSDDPWP